MSGQHRFAFGSALGDAGATTIASLPVDLVATQVLSHLSDPMDLAVLRAVSKGMRAAVDATGREIAEANDPQHAAERGFLTTLRHMHSRGRLKSADVNLLCYAAAKTGQLVELKALRAENWPWSEMTCAGAARRGHLEILKWARKNDCPWNEWTCAGAAAERPSRDAAVVARERLPVERVDVRGRGGGRPPRGSEVGARTSARGTCGRARARRGAAISRRCSGRENGCPWSELTCTNAAKTAISRC